MGTPKQDDFADLLRRFRLRAGLSQEALAERAGLSTNGVGGLERGIRTLPHADTVGRLGEALGLTAEEREAFAAAARPPRTTERATGAEEQVDMPLPGSGAVPEPPTLLIGRERELAEEVALLGRAEVRLLTLSGPGGVGKTRLALATAAVARDAGRFRDGVVFVDLAPIREPSLVVTAIARALGVAESGAAAPATRVFEHLKARQVLLVLDNFEHLLEAASLVTDLLAVCPLVKILATSRVRLRLRGERVLVVPPLSLPDENDESANKLAASDAVRLLADRMTDVDPGFAVTEENAAALAAICRRLDGLPLALELVAPWARLLRPEELRSRLEEGRLPSAVAPADLAPRQRTMRETIAWSYDLLDPDEQRIFRSLATFSGGWTLDAAEVVAPGIDTEPGEVLTWLAALVDKSLIRAVTPAARDGSETRRYAMFETVREFALERLEAAAEAETARVRHAAYFLDLAERADSHLQGPEQARWLDVLERDHANLRVALGWLLDGVRESRDDGLRLATSLWQFWTERGYLQDRRIWLEEAVREEVEPPTPMYARALLYVANLAMDLGDCRAATSVYERALAAWTTLEDERGIIAAMTGLGNAAHAGGAYDLANTYLREGLRRADRIAGEPNRIALLLNRLGVVATDEGKVERAEFALRQALSIWSEMGHFYYVAFSEWCLGRLFRIMGHTGAAETALDAAADGYLALANDRELARIRHERVLLSRDLGHFATAINQADETLAAWIRFDDIAGIVESLALIGTLAAEDGQHVDALRLLTMAGTWRERHGSVPPPTDGAMIRRALAAARSGLGESDAGRIVVESRTLRLDQATAVAQRFFREHGASGAADNGLREAIQSSK